MSNPIKKLLGQTAIYGLPSILGRMLNFLLVPIYIASFQDAKDYGVVSQLYAWVAFLVVFLSFGMETAFFRFLQNKEDKNEIFSNSFLTVIGINILFLLSILLFNSDVPSHYDEEQKRMPFNLRPLKMALGFFLLNCRRYHFTMNTQEPSSCLIFSRPLTSGIIVLIRLTF